MNFHQASLISQIQELEEILQSIPEEDIIERMSFSQRLETAKKLLINVQDTFRKSVARLTFRGLPVFGSHGISADFGSKAVGAFSEAFSSVLVSLNENLSPKGPIPDKAKNQLIITGTAIGSFGFELELPSQADDLFPSCDKSDEALEKIRSLFKVSSNGNDDEITEIVDDIHPRAAGKIYDFLEYLVQQQAWCGLEFNDEYFRFDNLEQIRSSLSRLRKENISENIEEYKGSFVGVLPKGRVFEFAVNGEGSVLKGKIDNLIEDPGVINREFLNVNVEIALRKVQVGTGKPRYTLTSLDSIRIV